MKALDLTRFLPLLSRLGFPRGHLLAVICLGLGLLFFSALLPSTEPESKARQDHTLEIAIATTEAKSEQSTIETEVKQVTEDLKQVAEDAEEITAEAEPEPAQQDTADIDTWHKEVVTSGDNLSLIFKRAGLTDSHLYKIINSSDVGKQLTKLYPGQEFRFQIVDQDLTGLWYKKDSLNSISFSRGENGFEHEVHSLEPEVYPAYREATITDSLFLAGTKANMEESLIMELANIFAWDVDFALDIRKNDSFKLLYEEQFLNGEKLRNGAILAAEFTNQGKTFRAVRFTDEDGNSNYYTPEGKSMRKAFLRTPVDFARISSHFNLNRKHPILNKIRAHKGTDYAAPTGTPIRSAGNGKVTFAGTKGGYGRTVVIKHGQAYKTLYAHMSKYGKGIRSGSRVKQGQIIGYVGSSGLATGPHLHYEFYLNGAVRNPVTVPLPKADSIPKAQLQAFQTQITPILAKFDGYTSEEDVQIAILEEQDSD